MTHEVELAGLWQLLCTSNKNMFKNALTMTGRRTGWSMETPVCIKHKNTFFKKAPTMTHEEELTGLWKLL